QGCGLGFHRSAAISVESELAGLHAVFFDSVVEQGRKQRGGFSIGDVPADHSTAENIKDHIEIEVSPFDRPHQFCDVPRPDLIGSRRQKLGLLIGGMAQLAAPFADLAVLGEDAIHGSDRAQIDALVEQARVDFGGYEIDEARPPQHIEDVLLLGVGQRPQGLWARPRGLWRGPCTGDPARARLAPVACGPVPLSGDRRRRERPDPGRVVRGRGRGHRAPDRQRGRALLPDARRLAGHRPGVESRAGGQGRRGARRNDLARAIAEEDPQVLAELDPLHDRAMSSPIGPTASMKRVFVVSKRFDWVIAGVAGVLLGLGLGNVRNDMSDDAMYRTIVAAGTVPAYQAYLAQNGRHADDVRDVLLPRAQLRDAEATGTVDAVQVFADAHPASRIGADITAALRRVMLAALDTAKKAGTVAPIDDLAKKYPNHTIDPEIKAARHSFFAQALDAWKKKGQPDAPTSAFIERLLAWSEAQGPGAPSAEVRFRMKPSKNLDDGDKSIRRGGHFPGL